MRRLYSGQSLISGGHDKMKVAKYLVAVFLVVAVTALLSGKVTAVGAGIDGVYLDNVRILDTGVNAITGVERGDSFTIKVETTATEDVSDAQVEAQIVGIHNEDVSDITDTFDMKGNVTYIKRLNLKIPDVADQDQYRLRVRVEDRAGSTEEKDYMLQLDAPRNLISIKDITFNPENEVKAGRSLLATVRVKNLGDKTEEGIKLRVSIPELGIAVSDTIDKLESDESTTSEELYMRIPTCADPGKYDVDVTATYDDGAKTTKMSDQIVVVADPTCPGFGEEAGGAQAGPDKTAITVPPSADVTIGTGGTSYPIMITNAASTSQTFTLSVAGVDTWGTSTFEPTNVLVVPGKGTATAFLYVTANNNAVAGKHTFALGVTTSSGTETIPLEANVLEGAEGASAAGATTTSEGFRRGLEIALIVLVMLLVILGLVIAFTKMKESAPKAEQVVEQEEKPNYY
jgi:hypothetical protein